MSSAWNTANGDVGYWNCLNAGPGGLDTEQRRDPAGRRPGASALVLANAVPHCAVEHADRLMALKVLASIEPSETGAECPGPTLHDARSHEALSRCRADHRLHEMGSLFACE